MAGKSPIIVYLKGDLVKDLVERWGGVGHSGVGWGHAGVGWGVLCRSGVHHAGVRWVMQGCGYRYRAT